MSGQEGDLAWRNRQVLAERLGWPDGELETCEQLERDHPGWTFSWRPANTRRGFECADGFHAQLLGRTAWSGWSWEAVRIFAATAEEMRERLAAMVAGDGA